MGERETASRERGLKGQNTVMLEEGLKKVVAGTMCFEVANINRKWGNMAEKEIHLSTRKGRQRKCEHEQL